MEIVGYVNLVTQVKYKSYCLVISAIEEFTIKTTDIIVDNEFGNPNSFSVSGITLPFLDFNVHEVFVNKGMTVVLTIAGTARENFTGKLFCLDSNEVFKIVDK